MDERQRATAGVAAALAGICVLLGVFLDRFRPARLLLSEIAAPAAAAGAVILASFAAGLLALFLARRLLARFLPGPAGDGTPLTDVLLIGFPMFGIGVAAVAWAGVALEAMVVNLVLVSAGAGIAALWRVRTLLAMPQSVRPAVVLLAVPVLFALVEAITPVNSPDELVYKLAIPRAYQMHGRMVEMPLNSNSYLVHALHFTDLAALIVSGGTAAKIARFLLFLAALASIHRTARRLAGEAGALITASVAFTPALMLIAGWCWNEWPVLALLVVSFEHYQRWLDERSHAGAAASALALGGALASKYTAIPWLMAFLLVAGWRHRREGRVLLLAGTVTALSGAFFYVRNLIWTGSPVAPLLLPDAPRVAQYRGGPWYAGWIDFARGADLFDPFVVDESLGVILVAGAVAGCFALVSSRRELRDLALLGAIQMPLLLTFAPGSRNMLGGIVPLAMAGLAVVIGAVRASPVILRVAVRAVGGVALLAQSVLVVFALESHEIGRYLAGKETRSEYVFRLRTFARPFAWVGRFTPPGSVVLLLAENRPYYLPRKFVAGSNLDGPRIAAWLSRFSSPAALHAEWRRMGITHVVFHKRWYRVTGTPQRPLTPVENEYMLEVTPQTDAIVTVTLKERAILRYRDRDYLIFELRPPGEFR